MAAVPILKIKQGIGFFKKSLVDDCFRLAETGFKQRIDHPLGFCRLLQRFNDLVGPDGLGAGVGAAFARTSGKTAAAGGRVPEFFTRCKKNKG